MEWLGLLRERRQFYQHLGARFFARSDFDWLAAATVSEAIVSLMPMYQYDSRPAAGREGHSTGRAVLAIRRFNEICEPFYYVNGRRIRINRRRYPEARIEDYVELGTVTAIEVYRPGAATPGDVDDGCGGAIVFWTLGPEGGADPP
ncbi:hypothetical protein BH23GEM9_BH23GEM9_24760 [soil metagenome]